MFFSANQFKAVDWHEINTPTEAGKKEVEDMNLLKCKETHKQWNCGACDNDALAGLLTRCQLFVMVDCILLTLCMTRLVALSGPQEFSFRNNTISDLSGFKLK